MNDVRERLVKCFAAVFPKMSEEEILRATPTSVEGWDSLSNVTLMSVIEEEFNTSIAMEDIEHFLSFEMALFYLKSRLRADGMGLGANAQK